MTDAARLFGDEHVRVYRETDGAVGHSWRRDSKILLLTTRGRTTGEPRTVPLIYERAGDAYVIVASNGGAHEHPGWYRNLRADDRVTVCVPHRNNPNRYVEVRGRAVLTDDDDRSVIDAMARAYMGVDRYPFDPPGAERVTITVIAEHVSVPRIPLADRPPQARDGA